MKTKIAVLAAALAVFGPCCSAQTFSTRDYAGVGAAAAAEAIRGVGREHEYPSLDAFAVDSVLPERKSWPWCGRIKSLTPMGEATLLYMEAGAARAEAEKKAKTQDALLAQSRALAALAGGGEEVSLALARQEKDLAKTRGDAAYFGAREAGLRRLLVEGRWAEPSPDGKLVLKAAFGTDVNGYEYCGDGGYDGAG